MKKAMTNVINAVFFRSTGLVETIKLEAQNTVAENWYTTK